MAVVPRRPTDSELFGGDPDFRDVPCPACGSEDTRLQSLFAGAASEVLFYCRGCRSCFSWVKWQHRLPGAFGAARVHDDEAR